MVKRKSARSLGKVLLAVAAAVVIIIAVILAMRHTGSSSLQSCSKDVAIVYADGQERLAEAMARILSRQLQGQGSNAICLVPASGVSKSFPLYPVILVRGHATSLFSKILMNESVGGGWRPIRLDYAASFAAQVAVAYRITPGPIFTHEAELLVVNGNTPFTRVNVSALEEYLKEPRYHILFSAMFLANITGVRVVDKPPAGEQPRVLPAFYAVSGDNLTYGAPSLRRVAPNVYSVDLNIASMIAGTPILEAFEVRALPNVTGHPSIGNGSVHLAVFEDFACPVCAAFYSTVMPALVKLAENNTLTIHFVDLIVHNNENVTLAHKTLLCLYWKTGNATLYYHLASKLYRTLRLYAEKGGAGYTSWLGDFVRNISREYNVSLDECPQADRVVEQSTMEAVHMGIMGTPGFAVWRNGDSYAIIVQGYHDVAFFEKLIGWLSARPVGS